MCQAGAGNQKGNAHLRRLDHHLGRQPPGGVKNLVAAIEVVEPHAAGDGIDRVMAADILDEHQDLAARVCVAGQCAAMHGAGLLVDRFVVAHRLEQAIQGRLRDRRRGGQADVGPCVIQPLLDSMGGAMTAAGVNASQVKVELFATAGMRTMSAFNGGGYSEDQIATFYNAMKTYAQTTKGFVVGEFRTSNGNKEEGVWTWINLNDQYYNAFGGNAAYYSGSPTTVGGSSMQVAFPTTALAVGDSNKVYTVSINGYTYNVFSKTYLGLGGDDARKFMRAYNFNNSTPSATYTGLDCFGSNANSSNTAENSGVALFNAAFFPSATTASGNPTGSLWEPTLSNAGGGTPLVMTSSGFYNLISCSSKFDNVTKNIIELPRNNYGTDSLGSQATYGSLITKVGSSSAPFVGLDGFYYTADSLGLVNGALKATFSASSFATALGATCPDGRPGPDGDNLRAVSVCPNAAYMKNFLWQASGLFTSNSGAIFEGVVPSNLRINGNKTAVLTWSRGYLMQKYAN